jgi:hypothetical protein
LFGAAGGGGEVVAFGGAVADGGIGADGGDGLDGDGGGGDVGDLDGEGGGGADLDAAEVEREGKEVERRWVGDSEEGDELECGAGVGGNFESGDAVGDGVGEDGLRGEADVDDAAGGGDKRADAVGLDGEVRNALEAVDVEGGGAGVAEGDGLDVALVAYLGGGEVAGVLGEGVRDQRSGVGGGGYGDRGGSAGEGEEVGGAEGVAFDDESAGVGCGGAGGGGGLVDWGVGEGGGTASVGGEGVAAVGGGDEEGPLAGETADRELRGAGVGEGYRLCGALAGGDLAEVEDGLARDDVAGDGEGGGADAEALDKAEAVEGGGAVGGCGLSE